MQFLFEPCVLYEGFHSYWLRHVAEGRPTYLAGFRSLSEVVLSYILCIVERGRPGFGRLGGLRATTDRTEPATDESSYRHARTGQE